MGERHRLDLVVGHVDRGDAERLLHVLELGAHMAAQLGVEVRQRLVHQEHRRTAHDGPRQGDALALAAGELAGIAVQQGVELNLRGRPRASGRRSRADRPRIFSG